MKTESKKVITMRFLIISPINYFLDLI